MVSTSTSTSEFGTSRRLNGGNSEALLPLWPSRPGGHAQAQGQSAREVRAAQVARSLPALFPGNREREFGEGVTMAAESKQRPGEDIH